MDSQTLGPLAVGVVAVVLGGLWMLGAVVSRRRRAAFSSTYASAGGIFYTAFQLGCAGALMLAGIAMVVIVVARR